MGKFIYCLKFLEKRELVNKSNYTDLILPSFNCWQNLLLQCWTLDSCDFLPVMFFNDV